MENRQLNDDFSTLPHPYSICKKFKYFVGTLVKCKLIWFFAHIRVRFALEISKYWQPRAFHFAMFEVNVHQNAICCGAFLLLNTKSLLYRSRRRSWTKNWTAICAEIKTISHFSCKNIRRRACNVNMLCCCCSTIRQETVFNVHIFRWWWSNDLNFKKS